MFSFLFIIYTERDLSMHKIEECGRKPTGDFVLYRPQCCDYTKKRIILWFRSMTSIISTPTWWSVQESHFRCTPGTSILTSTDAHPLEHHDCETRFLRYSNGKGREGKGRGWSDFLCLPFNCSPLPSGERRQKTHLTFLVRTTSYYLQKFWMRQSVKEEPLPNMTRPRP